MGFLSVTTNVDVDLLNTCYQLEPFHGLKQAVDQDEIHSVTTIGEIHNQPTVKEADCVLGTIVESTTTLVTSPSQSEANMPVDQASPSASHSSTDASSTSAVGPAPATSLGPVLTTTRASAHHASQGALSQHSISHRTSQGMLSQHSGMLHHPSQGAMSQHSIATRSSGVFSLHDIMAGDRKEEEPAQGDTVMSSSSFAASSQHSAAADADNQQKQTTPTQEKKYVGLV